MMKSIDDFATAALTRVRFMARLVGMLVDAVRAALRSRADLCSRILRSASRSRRLLLEAASDHGGRSLVLGDVASVLVAMERSACLRQTRDRGSVSSCRVPSILDVAVAARSPRQAANRCGSARADSSHGDRKYGRTEDPRRAAHARIRFCGADGVALFAAKARVARCR